MVICTENVCHHCSCDGLGSKIRLALTGLCLVLMPFLTIFLHLELAARYLNSVVNQERGRGNFPRLSE